MTLQMLAGLTAAVPMAATVMELVGSSGLSERHHSHHDTYIVSGHFSRMLVMAMVLMGALGLMLGWLCVLGAFDADATVIFAFFLAFLLVTFAFWLAIKHYRVVTYVDRMRITPFVGLTRTVCYRDIARLEWARPNSLVGYQSVRVFERGRKGFSTIWGSLDVDQILLRINRFDVLDAGTR